jgi:phage gpG-like protein
MAIKVKVDPGDHLKSALRDAVKQVGNLTIPLQQIARSWFKSNRAIYELQGKGQYEDLKESYKRAKDKKLGFIYPILLANGKLRQSILHPADVNSVNLIVNKRTLIMGSKLEYAYYLQHGTKHMPARPYVLIGAEQSGISKFNEREKIYIDMIHDYVRQVLKKVTGEK